MSVTLQTDHTQDEELRYFDFDRTIKVGEAVTHILHGQTVDLDGAQVVLAEE